MRNSNHSQKRQYGLFVMACVACVSLLAGAESCLAATLHSILVCYTDEPGRPDRPETYKMLATEAENIARQTGLTYQEYHFVGSNFNYMKLANFLKSFRVDADDAVLFVYDGHGANVPGTQWPAFQFPNEKRLLPFAWVIDQLRKGQPRLLIALSGACNSPAEGMTELMKPPNLFSGAKVVINSACYKALFVKARGEVLGTASQPGVVSWGNFYPSSFVENLQSRCKQKDSNATWEQLMQRVSSTVQKKTQTLYDNGHIPSEYRDTIPQTPVLDISSVVRAPQFSQPQLPQKQQPAQPEHDQQEYESLAEQLLQQGDLENTFKVLDEGLQLYPASVKLWELTLMYAFQLDPSQRRNNLALAAAKKALELDPSPEHYASAGMVYQAMLGDCPSALSHYAKTEGYADQNPFLYYLIAQCCENVGKTDLAISSYSRFLEADPGSEQASAARQRLSALQSKTTKTQPLLAPPSSASRSSKGELLKNGNFAKGTSGWNLNATNWAVYKGDDGRPFLATNDANHKSQGPSVFQDVKGATGGQTYTFDAEISTVICGTDITMTIWEIGGGANINSTERYDGCNNWQRFSVSHAKQRNNSTLRVEIYYEAVDADIWIRDAHLR